MKANILHGTSIISIFLLGAAVGAHQLMEAYPNQMDQFFGTKSSTIEYQKIGEGDATDPWNFKSQFKTAAQAIEPLYLPMAVCLRSTFRREQQ